MFDFVPIWGFFIAVFLVVLLSIEAGYRLMKRRRKQANPENDALVSVISAAVLGLLGFVLAFVFSIVYARYEVRKELVRQEASAIRRAWLRSDFLEEPARDSTVAMLKRYLDVRLEAAEANSSGEIARDVAESITIQKTLWAMGVASAKRNAISGMNAPYIQSLNDLIDIHNQRMAVGVIDRIPSAMWIGLLALLLFSMMTVGYFSGLKDTKRSLMTFVLALSFSIVFVLILALDRPLLGLFKASQQPLINVKAMLEQ